MLYVTYACHMARSQHAMVSDCFSLFSFVDCLYHQTVFFVLVVRAMFSSNHFSYSHCLDNWTLSEGVCLCLLVALVRLIGMFGGSTPICAPGARSGLCTVYKTSFP